MSRSVGRTQGIDPFPEIQSGISDHNGILRNSQVIHSEFAGSQLFILCFLWDDRHTNFYNYRGIKHEVKDHVPDMFNSRIDSTVNKGDESGHENDKL